MIQINLDLFLFFLFSSFYLI